MHVVAQAIHPADGVQFLRFDVRTGGVHKLIFDKRRNYASQHHAPLADFDGRVLAALQRRSRVYDTALKSIERAEQAVPGEIADAGEDALGLVVGGHWAAGTDEQRDRREAGDERDIDDAAKLLLAAKTPMIIAGQGVLYAEACDELLALAELLDTPVMTTTDGKSAFPEDHALALGSGTDVAISAADLILLRDDLSVIPDAIRLSRATLATIRRNLAWAIGYNIAALPLAGRGDRPGDPVDFEEDDAIGWEEAPPGPVAHAPRYEVTFEDDYVPSDYYADDEVEPEPARRWSRRGGRAPSPE